jgi:hypothetical protein
MDFESNADILRDLMDQLHTLHKENARFLHKIEDLGAFYKRFTGEKYKENPAIYGRVKLCIDTAHIFAAGWKIGNSAGQLSGSLDILVKSPFLANTTAYNTTANYGSNMGPQSGIEINAGYHAAGTSYDGFTLTFTSNAIGTVRVYGLRN